jgi:hypothetical protein
LATEESFEQMHNRILRRADWRFLLPDPEPERSICFARGILAQSVDEISCVMEDEQNAAEETCDLAVARNPDHSILKRAWHCLRPGGAVYIEYSHPILGGYAKIQKKLEDQGFTYVGVYWPWPFPDRRSALFWLPVDSPQALYHYLENNSPPRTWFVKIARSILLSLWHAIRSMGVLAPLSFIAIKPKAQSTGAVTNDFTNLQSENWKNLLDQRLPNSITSLLKTGGGRSISKVSRLVFVDEESSPRLVIKFARNQKARSGLSHENSCLLQFRENYPMMQSSVPGPIVYREQKRTAMLGESFMPGLPMFLLINRGNYYRYALQATDWLLCLQKIENGQPDPGWREKYAEPIFDQFQKDFRGIVSTDELKKIWKILKAVEPLPAIFEHRDFSPWNIFITSDGKMNVLDWESSQPDGIPGPDLFYFLSYLAFFVEGKMPPGDFRLTYQQTLSLTTFIGSVQKECENRYFTRLGLSLATAPALRMLTWMIHSHSDFLRIAEDSNGVAKKERLEQSVFYSLWQLEFRRFVEMS